MIFSKIDPFNADIYTPVELYLSLRNRYRKTCLLESNDYHSRSNSKSFIGVHPIIEIKLENNQLEIETPNGKTTQEFKEGENIVTVIQEVLSDFPFANPLQEGCGFFGRFGFEFALLTENSIYKKQSDTSLPDIHLFLFRHVIVIDHFTDNGFVVTNAFSKGEAESYEIENVLTISPYTHLPFEIVGSETGDFTDDEFAELVKLAQDHCQRGDVFQLVLSNRFEQTFFGDDFQVYRQLRRLNPSPYLFYFDFESYRLFGSSPEAQLIVKNGKAEIHPIAGTVAKTGIPERDAENIRFLLNDDKENAEHTMLVDLARNDLSKDCSEVKSPVSDPTISNGKCV